jgi:hypothetical protein
VSISDEEKKSFYKTEKRNQKVQLEATSGIKLFVGNYAGKE